MAFNSLEFFLFLAVVWTLYNLLNHRGQNLLLLMASYLFYGLWNWRCLFLIAFSSTVDFFVAKSLSACGDKKKKRKILALSIVTNLGILAFFKYFNFFLDSLYGLLGVLGMKIHGPYLTVLLPVGISFYTFKTMSYSLDVYRGQLQPCKSIADYYLYVSFFPQLVAGPIERAQRLLPQILNKRVINSDLVANGALLIFWGLFKKLFIADNLMQLVNEVFGLGNNPKGVMVLLGAYAFTLQVYSDFSAYSDIARGVARLFGFDTVVNFRLPFFASNLQDFWNRWHISLTSWIRDYLYYPLALTRIRGRTIPVYWLTVITFTIMGLWHGASWTFVLWGTFHGAMLALYALNARRIRNTFGKLVGVRKAAIKFAGMLFVFNIAAYGSILFRAPSLDQALIMLRQLFFNFGFTQEAWNVISHYGLYAALLFIVELTMLEWKGKLIGMWIPTPIRYVCYSIAFYLMSALGQGATSFIYTQF